MLAWYRMSARGAVGVGLTGAILFVVLLFVVRGFELRVLGIWWIWVAAVVTGMLIGLSIKVDWCAAGADWFRCRKAWVKTYELAEIKTGYATKDVSITLTDRDGRFVSTTFSLMKADRAVWDYLYNGIMHSIAAGAELHGTARRYFGGPPSALKPPES